MFSPDALAAIGDPNLIKIGLQAAVVQWDSGLVTCLQSCEPLNPREPPTEIWCRQQVLMKALSRPSVLKREEYLLGPLVDQSSHPQLVESNPFLEAQLKHKPSRVSFLQWSYHIHPPKNQDPNRETRVFSSGSIELGTYFLFCTIL